jgi:hypothetical protein
MVPAAGTTKVGHWSAMVATDTDADWESGGVTRQAVLEARGYPPDVVNGHGPAGGPINTKSLSVDRVDELEGGSACVVCGGQLDAERQHKQAKTCGDSCAREHRARRRKASRANGTATAPTIARDLSDSGDRNWTPGVRNQTEKLDDFSGVDAGAPGGGLRPMGLNSTPDRLGPIYTALAVAGAHILRLEVSVGQETWAITRTTNGGAL